MRMTVLIVDDHATFRRFASRLLELTGFSVVGEAGDGASAVAAVEELRPDLVLLDVMLPDASGFAIATELQATPSPPRVVLTSSRNAADYGELLDPAACSFIAKHDLTPDALRHLLERE